MLIIDNNKALGNPSPEGIVLILLAISTRGFVSSFLQHSDKVELRIKQTEKLMGICEE